MKACSRTIRRTNDGHAAAELSRDELVIPIPDPRLIRLIARSVFLAAVLFSLPWLRSALFSDYDGEIDGHSAKDELFYMPKLLQDMKSYGLIQLHGRSLFLGNPGIHAPLLRRNGVYCLPERKIPQIGSAQSLDFVFLVAGGFNDAHFRFIDPAVSVGGVVAFRLGNHPVKPFNLPANYRMIYIQNIGRTIIAVKKLYHGNAGGGKPGRRLLSVPEAKEDDVQAAVDALLEPPAVEKHRKRIRYLPKLIGESLDKYPRRVFVDIGSPGRIGAEGWFREKYPGNKEFDMVRVDVVDPPPPTGGGSGDVGEWLRSSVRKEYVVVKAEAEVVEELVKGEAFELVDELFLECRSDWKNGEVEEELEEEEGKWTKRANWECLALFDKLRQSGVAVHPWWG
ncbi:uncharacterized protein LOC110021527 [Phalaenopsis equestris]|uniref:uncharacterized protein LOC110021527 n=1 Tax=Phalaenopsis equestris TaxID=78828 RepID=UPI0009E20997|nr:uncharacterized protein LOC110021527 [Phalaenopsis equestris]